MAVEIENTNQQPQTMAPTWGHTKEGRLTTGNGHLDTIVHWGSPIAGGLAGYFISKRFKASLPVMLFSTVVGVGLGWSIMIRM